MPYKDKKDLYAAQKRYRARKKAEYEQIKKEHAWLKRIVVNLIVGDRNG